MSTEGALSAANRASTGVVRAPDQAGRCGSEITVPAARLPMSQVEVIQEVRGTADLALSRLASTVLEIGG